MNSIKIFLFSAVVWLIAAAVVCGLGKPSPTIKWSASADRCVEASLGADELDCSEVDWNKTYTKVWVK